MFLFWVEIGSFFISLRGKLCCPLAVTIVLIVPETIKDLQEFISPHLVIIIQDRILTHLFMPLLEHPLKADASIPSWKELFFWIGVFRRQGTEMRPVRGTSWFLQNDSAFPLMLHLNTNCCSLSFSLSNGASNWHWKIILLSLLKNPACGRWCWKNEFHFSSSLSHLFNYCYWKHWGMGLKLCLYRLNNCQHFVVSTDLKDRGRNTEKIQ